MRDCSPALPKATHHVRHGAQRAAPRRTQHDCGATPRRAAALAPAPCPQAVRVTIRLFDRFSQLNSRVPGNAGQSSLGASISGRGPFMTSVATTKPFAQSPAASRSTARSPASTDVSSASARAAGDPAMRTSRTSTLAVASPVMPIAGTGRNAPTCLEHANGCVGCPDNLRQARVDHPVRARTRWTSAGRRDGGDAGTAGSTSHEVNWLRNASSPRASRRSTTNGVCSTPYSPGTRATAPAYA